MENTVNGNNVPPAVSAISMHRLKVNKLVAIILISQVVCLAVLSTAIWEFQGFHGKVAKELESTAAEPPPGFMTKPRSDRDHVFRTPRFLGKSGLVSECISMQLRAHLKQELIGAEPGTLDHCGALSDPKTGPELGVE